MSDETERLKSAHFPFVFVGKKETNKNQIKTKQKDFNKQTLVEPERPEP